MLSVLKRDLKPRNYKVDWATGRLVEIKEEEHGSEVLPKGSETASRTATRDIHV